MRFVLLPVVAVGLVLSACADRKDVELMPAPRPQAAAVLGGVDLGKPVRAVGTEPFWHIDITQETIELDRAGQAVRRAPNHGATIKDNTATYATSTPYQEAINVMLTVQECSDGMSDRTYPLTARVEFGDQVLTGCAASVSALMSVGESGRVE